MDGGHPALKWDGAFLVACVLSRAVRGKAELLRPLEQNVSSRTWTGSCMHPVTISILSLRCNPGSAAVCIAMCEGMLAFVRVQYIDGLIRDKGKVASLYPPTRAAERWPDEL
eukprot:981299-Pelagomonas_calceolata.AAC.1